MKVLINHLTRMQPPCICTAGVDLETRRHVRPLFLTGAPTTFFLARHGGPIDFANVVDLGVPRAAPKPPHVEDHIIHPEQVKKERTAAPEEFWAVLEFVCRPTLRDIFGADLMRLGGSRFGTMRGKGTVSLGCLHPRLAPRLFIAPDRAGKPRIRARFTDGEIEADAAVTDIRFYGADHATPDETLVTDLARSLVAPADIILCVGLTREFTASAQAGPRHWLQVTGIHRREQPVWQLG